MPNLGLDFGALSAANSQLICLSMPSFGSTGPFAQYVSYGSGLELATGLGISGPNGDLEPAPVPYLDLLSGVYGAIAILGALVQRHQINRGVKVEVAQHAVARHLRSWSPSGLWADSLPTAESILQSKDLLSKGPFGWSQDPNGYCRHFTRCPWHLPGLAVGPEDPAPTYGAHSTAVLRDIAGASPPAIQWLLESGATISADSRTLAGIA
jgi:crotonobetainyl-CoA:carnitine CoA-transferase CaiB-like acyl-CoA transferase